MRYLLFLSLLTFKIFASSLEFIEEMKYETNYEIASKKAVSQNKILMMVVTSKSCPWCRKLERQTLKKDEINNLIQSSFIPLSVDQDLKNFPLKYEVKVVPTIYFIDAKNGEILQKVMGYKTKKDFEEILNEVKER